MWFFYSLLPWGDTQPYRKLEKKKIFAKVEKIGVSHCIRLRCSTWPKIDLHLNVIICTRWSGSIENIHIGFHLIEKFWIVKHVYFAEISAQFVALINEGKRHHSVTLQYNLAHGIVNHIYQQYVVMGSFAHKLPSGHPRAMDIQQHTNITRIAIENPYLISNRMAMEVNFFGNTLVSSHTVYHRLCTHGLTSTCPNTHNRMLMVTLVFCFQSWAGERKGLEASFLH